MIFPKALSSRERRGCGVILQGKILPKILISPPTGRISSLNFHWWGKWKVKVKV
jgi:hypothetical protein